MPAMMRRNGCSISNDSDMQCKDAACCYVYVCVSLCWSHPSAILKQLNQLRYRLGFGLRWAQGTMC